MTSELQLFLLPPSLFDARMMDSFLFYDVINSFLKQMKGMLVVRVTKKGKMKLNGPLSDNKSK